MQLCIIVISGFSQYVKNIPVLEPFTNMKIFPTLTILNTSIILDLMK